MAETEQHAKRPAGAWDARNLIILIQSVALLMLLAMPLMQGFSVGGVAQRDAPQADAQAAAAAQEQQTAEPKLVATWRAYSMRPPAFALDNLLVYDNGACRVQTRQGAIDGCRWTRLDDSRLRLSLSTSEQPLVAQLLPPRALASRVQTGSAAFLRLALPNGQVQDFVLADTPDAAMTRAAVQGEFAWSNGRYEDALRAFEQAVAAGDRYSRVRLGWLLAAAEGVQQPKRAVALLEPLAETDTYAVQTAWAAALAADGRFQEAIAAGERACGRASADEAAACAERLGRYRAGEVFSFGARTGDEASASETHASPH